jgi:hypothetical protein
MAKNMKNLVSYKQQRALAIRMARVRIPENEIAFLLGMTIEDLQRLFGADMQRAALLVDLAVLENLARMALSDDCPEAATFWAEHFCTPNSEEPVCIDLASSGYTVIEDDPDPC